MRACGVRACVCVCVCVWGQLDSTVTITCADGKWNKQVSCEPVDCGLPDKYHVHPALFLFPNGTTYGKKSVFQCKEPAQLVGESAQGGHRGGDASPPERLHAGTRARTHARTHERTHARTRAHAYTRTHTHAHTRTHTHTHPRVKASTRAHMYTHSPTRACTHPNMRAGIHTHTRAYTHPHMH